MRSVYMDGDPPLTGARYTELTFAFRYFILHLSIWYVTGGTVSTVTG